LCACLAPVSGAALRDRVNVRAQLVQRDTRRPVNRQALFGRDLPVLPLSPSRLCYTHQSTRCRLRQLLLVAPFFDAACHGGHIPQQNIPVKNNYSAAFIERSSRLCDNIWMSMARIGPRKPHRHFIREWMKAKGVTQEKLADRLGISQGTVSKALKSRTVLTEEYLMGIAEALDVQVADLFRDPKSPTQEELLRGLSEPERLTVIRMIEALRNAG
jgi:DNA-binding Xre family transcriptional regulator